MELDTADIETTAFTASGCGEAQPQHMGGPQPPQIPEVLRLVEDDTAALRCSIE